MVNLCDRCEQVFEAASKAFAVPGVAEWCSWEFGPYQALQENAEGRRCQLCCILFSLRRQYTVDQFIENQHQDKLYYTFELGDEDSDLLFLNLFHPNQDDARLFSSRLRVKKCACQWLSFGSTLAANIFVLSSQQQGHICHGNPNLVVEICTAGSRLAIYMLLRPGRVSSCVRSPTPTSEVCRCRPSRKDGKGEVSAR